MALILFRHKNEIIGTIVSKTRLFYNEPSMKKITLDEIHNLARLSRIKLSDEEARSLRKDLESILGYVDQLAEVDTSELETTSQVTGLTNQTRKDVVKDYGVSREDLLKNAPARQDGFIKVKKVL